MILFSFNQLPAGRPGGLVVSTSNTTNVCLSLSSIPTTMRFDFICRNAKKRDQLLRASTDSSVSGYNSTRVDEERKCWLFFAIKMKARAEVPVTTQTNLCDSLQVTKLSSSKTSPADMAPCRCLMQTDFASCRLQTSITTGIAVQSLH